MTARRDTLGIGAAAVDDLLYVEHFPQPDNKQPTLTKRRQGGGLTATTLVAAFRLGAHTPLPAGWTMMNYPVLFLRPCCRKTWTAQTDKMDPPQHIEAVRRFNRFYTRQIGVLHEKLLSSPFSLTEARIIYELAHHEKTTATELSHELGLDAGYLSRILHSFKKRGLIDKQPSQTDGRQSLLWLTQPGQETFATLNARSHHEIEATLNKLSSGDQNRLVEAMHTIEDLLNAQPEPKVPYILRPPQPGDMGWIVHRHRGLCAQEYGWDEQFEALMAEIVAKFIQHYNPKRERCWIAEKDGENVGSVFLVKESDSVAELRLLLVEPRSRGLGIGTRLVNECIRFARQAGYEKLTLWTNNVLLAARQIYEKSGFRLIHQEAHHSFGHNLIGETWELALLIEKSNVKTERII